MDSFKKIRAWGKDLQQKPEARFVLGMVGGLMIGVGAENLLLGIGLAIALGVPGYVSGKKIQKDGDGDTER